jgi:hypothetical protein
MILVIACSPAAFAGGLLAFDYCHGIHPYCCTRVPSGSIVTLDINILSPVNPEFESQGSRAVTSISGFELGLAMDPGMYLLDVIYPVPALNFGEQGSLVVGFGTPVPVVDYITTLATVSFLVVAPADPTLSEVPLTYPCHYYFDPAEYLVTGVQVDVASQPSIAGKVAIVDADDTIDPLVVLDNTPASDEWDYNPGRFRIRFQEEDPISAENESWGSIKSLYR